MTLTVGSLFSGIGGLELGLERAGMRVRWQVEQDTYALKVLQRHWPRVPKHPDVRRVGAHSVERVDLICGGFPCQDISLAGKGGGLGGARSGLWSEFARIVGELKPSWVLIENVPALRSRGLRVVLGDLHARGFDAEWDGLPASAFGAPHRRDRVFVVAYAHHQGQLQPRGPFCEVGGRARDGGQRSDVADAVRARLEEPRNARGHAGSGGARVFAAPARGRPWPAEPDVGRVAHGVPARVDRLRCIGNAVVPAVAEWLGRRILEAA